MFATNFCLTHFLFLGELNKNTSLHVKYQLYLSDTNVT
jgi:hypothetical protein